MGPLVIVVLVGLTLVITARSIRNTLTDRRSLEEHSKALDTLGEVAHQQDWATPLASDLPGARAHVRVVGPEATPASPERALRRGATPRAPIAPPIPPGALPPPNAPPATPSPNASPAVRTPDRRLPPPPAGAPRRSGHWRIEPTVAPAPSPAPVPMPPEPATGLVLGSVAPTSPSTASKGSRPSWPSRPAPPAHRRRRTLVPAGAVAAVVVVIIAVGLAAVLGRSDRQRPPAAAIAEPAATVPATAPAPSTTATTAAPAVLVSNDNQGARYNLASSATVELVPSSPCWVEIRGGNSTGPVVFQGVLRPGDHRPIQATAAVWLRLGNPHGMAIVVNGTPLQPPAQSTQPYNITLAPAAGG